MWPPRSWHKEGKRPVCRRKKGVPLGELSPQATEGVGVQRRTFEMLLRFLLLKSHKCAILSI